MLHLLKIEWLKVKNYRTFWVIFILYLASIILANYGVYLFQQIIFGEEARQNPNNEVLKWILGNPPYSFPQVWQMASQVTSYLLIIPGLLVLILVTNEYSYKTQRQNLIDGLTREQFITSKILMVIVFAICSTIMVAIASMIFGFTGVKPFSMTKSYYVLLSFVQCLNYCLAALLLAVLCRRSGIAIGIYFLYVVIFENVLFLIMNEYLYNTGYYLPVESSDGLIYAPIAEGFQKEFMKRPDPKYIFAACVIYIALYVFFSYKKFKKDDL